MAEPHHVLGVRHGVGDTEPELSRRSGIVAMEVGSSRARDIDGGGGDH